MNASRLKCTLLWCCFVITATVARGQGQNPAEKVVMTAQNQKTQASTNKAGELLVNVAPQGRANF